MNIDEIIKDAEKQKAETLLLIDIQRIIGADLPYEAVQLARYIEHREAQTREALAEAEEWKLELVRVFKRNIRMHEDSPYVRLSATYPKEAAEVEQFVKGLKRGLEILEFDYDKRASRKSPSGNKKTERRIEDE